MESKTYEIIPDLVSIESSVKTIRGSYFFKELNLCPITNQKNRFHYKLNLQNNVYVPTKYDFRNGYYFKNGSYWYYQRTLFKNITLKLKFDPREKTFYFNRLYHLIPFEIGGIFPAGKHIADLINLDLSLSGFDVIRGLAFRYQEQVICCVIPSFNGKTSLMKKILESGGEYIAEDILVINHRDSTVYPTPPIGDNYGRKINSELRDEAIKKRLKKGQKINKMYLLHNSTSSNEKNLGGIDFFNYFMMNSLLFLNNGFIKSYIFTEKLWDQILKKVDHAKRYQNKYHTLHIKEFIFDELITLVDEKNRSHWEKMGGSYNKAWTNPAKQTLNQKELNFIEQSLRRVNPEKVLDIGVGNGRIIESILKNSSAKSVYGIDLAQEMIKVCQSKFKTEKRVKALYVCDISKEDISSRTQFDFITAIRVLKYNENWKDIVIKTLASLNPNGVFIFTMPNNNSLNRFSKYPIVVHKTTRKEINETLSIQSGEVSQITSFTKIPDILYEASKNKIYAKAILLLEDLLQLLLGKTYLGRELFIEVRKK